MTLHIKYRVAIFGVNIDTAFWSGAVFADFSWVNFFKPVVDVITRIVVLCSGGESLHIVDTLRRHCPRYRLVHHLTRHKLVASLYQLLIP